VSGPALLAVAHGSRNPAAAEVVRTVGRQIARLAPVLDVRVAFLGHAEPSLPAQLDAAGRGAVIVPLLLSSGYHISADIAAAAQTSGARVAAPLGPDQLLLTALTARLAEAGVPDGTPLVLAAAGSSDPAAMTDVGQQAELLAAHLDVPVRPAYLSAAQPAVADAVRGLRAQTGRQVAVASYLLAPGQFQDQLADSGADWVTAPLGGHPALAGIVIDRYRTAARSN
jgi:sirohydrochlorin ferrochelatase